MGMAPLELVELAVCGIKFSEKQVAIRRRKIEDKHNAETTALEQEVSRLKSTHASEQIEIKGKVQQITKETAAREKNTREQLDSLVAENEKLTLKLIQETTKKNEIQFQYETNKRKYEASAIQSHIQSEALQF